MKTLSEEARKLRNAYQKQWRLKNPQKNYQYGLNYWERKALKADVTLTPTIQNDVTLTPTIQNDVTLTPTIQNDVTLTPTIQNGVIYEGLFQCLNCGSSFPAIRSTAKYCSKSCKQSHFRKNSKS